MFGYIFTVTVRFGELLLPKYIKMVSLSFLVFVINSFAYIRIPNPPSTNDDVYLTSNVTRCDQRVTE